MALSCHALLLLIKSFAAIVVSHPLMLLICLVNQSNAWSCANSCWSVLSAELGFRAKPINTADGSRVLMRSLQTLFLLIYRDAQEVSKAAEVLLLLGDKGVCDEKTLRMLQALTQTRGGVPSAGAPVLKRVVDSMAQDQAVVQIRRCLDALHAPE